MHIVSASDARNQLSSMLEQAQHAPIVIQKQGKNAGVLLSYEAYERLAQAPAKHFMAISKRIAKSANARALTEDAFDALMKRPQA